MGFLFILYLSRDTKEYRIVKYEDAIAPISLNGTERFGYLRGSVFYSKNRFIGGDEVLIGARCKENELMKFNINSKTLKTVSHDSFYRLSDINSPFIISKKANNDTIVVKKDDCIFYFKLSDYDGPYQ